MQGEAGVPEVTGVSPNEGPVEGGQRVVLRGSYLGESRADVMQVLVAGVDCSSSLEYFSPCECLWFLLIPHMSVFVRIARLSCNVFLWNGMIGFSLLPVCVCVPHSAKLAVVTVARAAPGSGPVLVQTRTGGVGVSWINFSFVEADDGGGLANSSRHHSKRRSRIGIIYILTFALCSPFCVAIVHMARARTHTCLHTVQSDHCIHTVCFLLYFLLHHSTVECNS